MHGLKLKQQTTHVSDSKTQPHACKFHHFNTQFLVFNAKFLVLNTKFMTFTHAGQQLAALVPTHRVNVASNRTVEPPA